jgi:hypothetical protein
VSTKFGTGGFLLKFSCQISFSFQRLLWLSADSAESLPGFENITHRKVLGSSREILSGLGRKLYSGNILTEFVLDN